MLRYPDIVAQIGTLWGPNPPSLLLDGQGVKLVSENGTSVSFLLTGAQLKLSMADFSKQVLEPQIAKLRDAK